MPAKAGIQFHINYLDSGLRRNDGGGFVTPAKAGVQVLN
jgi:hypothetical protein